MKLTIDLSLDNAAFYEENGGFKAFNDDELRRILNKLSYRVREAFYYRMSNTISEESVLMDYNGNTVGTWKLEKDK